jgi:hypothetical protein
MNRVAAWQAGSPAALLVPDWHSLDGTGPLIGAVMVQFASGLFVSLGSLFVLFLLRVVVRTDWVALLLLALLIGGSRVGGIESWATMPVLIAGGALRTFVLVRIGLVAAIVDAFVWTVFGSSPMTLQTSAWYSSAGFVSLGIIGAIAVYGFRTALLRPQRFHWTH